MQTCELSFALCDLALRKPGPRPIMQMSCSSTAGKAGEGAQVCCSSEFRTLANLVLFDRICPCHSSCKYRVLQAWKRRLYMSSAKNGVSRLLNASKQNMLAHMAGTTSAAR